MTTDTFRALCAELLQPLAEYDGANPYHEHRDLITRARAALAEPEPPADGEVAIPCNADIAAAMMLLGKSYLREHAPERLAKPEPDTEESLAAQPADGEVAELVAELELMANHAAAACQFGDAKYLTDAADLLERLAVTEPVGPTDEELVQLACSEELGRLNLDGSIITRFYYPKDIGENVIAFARSVLARWGKS